MISSLFAKVLKAPRSMWFILMNKLLNRRYCYCLNYHIGIGNRLITLMNQYVWCGKENIRLCWGLDDWMSVPFSDLFVMSDAPGFSAKATKISQWSRMSLIPYPQGHEKNSWRFYVPAERRRDGVEKIDCLYEKTPQWAITAYEPFFKQLKPSPAVAERIKTCPIPDDAVCVQIRNSHRSGDYANVSTLDRVLSLMREYDANQRFFVAAVELDYFKKIEQAFPDRVFGLPNKKVDSAIDTVAELWLLGQGRELICMGGSTFPEISWWWGGRRCKVRQLKKDYQQKD